MRATTSVDHRVGVLPCAGVIDSASIWDETGMLPRSSLVVCCVAVSVACAASQVDEMPRNFGGDTQTAGASNVAGGGQAATAGAPPTAGSFTAPQGGGSAGGSPSAAAGTSTAGSSGKAGASAGGAAGASVGGAAGSGVGGGSTKPPSTNLPFVEDFEDGSANGFIPWNSKGTPGMWEVVADGAGKVYGPKAAPSELELAVGGSTAWTDVTMTVKVRLADSNAGAQVVLRFKDPKTYLFVEMAVGKYKLRAKANGSTTDVISPSPKPTIVAGMWHTVGVTAKGTTATLTLDGIQIGMPTMFNAALSNGGVALGVAEGMVTFDDLKVDVAP